MSEAALEGRLTPREEERKNRNERRIIFACTILTAISLGSTFFNRYLNQVAAERVPVAELYVLAANRGPVRIHAPPLETQPDSITITANQSPLALCIEYDYTSHPHPLLGNRFAIVDYGANGFGVGDEYLTNQTGAPTLVRFEDMTRGERREHRKEYARITQGLTELIGYCREIPPPPKNQKTTKI